MKALFGFGIRNSKGYLYLSVSNQRLEAPVYTGLGKILSVTRYDEGFVTYSCESEKEEYVDFYEHAEFVGVLNEWKDILISIKELDVSNE